MTISAEVIADSVNQQGVRLTTFQLRYPRFIHAEVMTHRVFSRNASSSRAIPVKRMIEDVIRDTAMPIHWGKNQPGMQADEEHDALIYGACGTLDMVENLVEGVSAQMAWLQARDRAIEVAEAFHAAKYHKQVVNRILEPFMHINVIVTATNFDNFYWLRRHPDAQPEIKVLADAMYDAQAASTPVELAPGEWHLPYVTEADRKREQPYRSGYGETDFDIEVIETSLEDLVKISVARCARVSYLTHDGRVPDFIEDIELYDRLVGSVPLHSSPAEHQAMADQGVLMNSGEYLYVYESLSGNFDPGFVQYRKTLQDEVCTEYVPA